MQEQHLRRALADQLELPAGADLSEMTPDEPKVRPAMESLYAERNGQGGLIALKEAYRASNTGKLEESVGDQAMSVVTGLLGRKPTLGTAEIAHMKGLDFYAVLHQRLHDAEAVPDAALHDLARARGDTAVAVFSAAKVPPDRVIRQGEERVEAKGNSVPLGMALSAAK